MAFSFPTSPTLGQIYIAPNGVFYKWDGAKWSGAINPTTAGTVTTVTANAQPNITSLGTLTSLVVSGTSNLGAVGNVTITGGTSGQVLTTNGSNVLSWTTVSGGGTPTGVANGTSTVSIPLLNGNVNTSVGGVANVLVVTTTGANITGSANIVGAVALGSSLSVTGTSNLGAVGNVTITGGTSGQVLTTNGSNVLSWATVSSSSLSNVNTNVTIPVASGNVNFKVGGTSGVMTITSTGANVSGYANITGAISTASTVTATGNITGGNITTAGLANTGSLSVVGTSNLGAVGNVTITGGTTGQALITDGAGVLSWASAIGGGSENIQVFATSGTFTVPSGVTKLRVTAFGGGGGGGWNIMAGAGFYQTGGSGGSGTAYLTGVTPGSTIAVTVGSGGAGSVGSSNGLNPPTTGSAGGTSSFGTYVTATGGGGGSALVQTVNGTFSTTGTKINSTGIQFGGPAGSGAMAYVNIVGTDYTAGGGGGGGMSSGGGGGGGDTNTVAGSVTGPGSSGTGGTAGAGSGGTGGGTGGGAGAVRGGGGGGTGGVIVEW